MSHILSAGVYIADSKQRDLVGDSFYVLSNIIRHIIDGLYNDTSIHLDSIRPNNPELPAIKTIIRGISLGDGDIHIYNRSDIEKNIGGKKGRIGVLHQRDDQVLTLDLAMIQSITQEKVHQLVQPEDIFGALTESDRNFLVRSSESGLLVRMH